ncbi:MAG TPA: sulfite exporter TauE/SafE family protein [Chitinophagaceae bacterium]|nr:sulfite exporter TauE/SafE family protein [Chitinophagaceae bacterium]
MLWAAIIAGFSLGAVSSLHCVGMCGPLALALPVHHLSKTKQLLSLFLFQSGRIITYSLFGLIFGLAGRRIYLAGFQQWFSIIMGVIVLLLVILYWVYKNPLQPSLFKRLFIAVQNYMMKAFHSKKSPAGFILLGMANGLLPCAMVYVAIAGALTATQVSYSLLFMAMFGAGTLPAMMIVGYFGRMVSLPVRNMFRQSVPVFMGIIGIVLILRGMNIGIPFISPVLEGASASAVNCHP